MPNYHVIVHGTDRDGLANLSRVHHVYVYRQTLIDDGSGYRVSALADEQTIQRLQRAGYQVEQHDDVHHAVQRIRHRAALGEHGHGLSPATRMPVEQLPYTQTKPATARSYDCHAQAEPPV